MMEYWNNVLKTYNHSILIKVFGINFHSMVCLSHEPYYFSTKWNTNVPNIALKLHCVPIIPLFHHSDCERNELSSSGTFKNLSFDPYIGFYLKKMTKNP